MLLCGPSCKIRLLKFSARLKFQDGPSVAITMPFYIIKILNTFGSNITTPQPPTVKNKSRFFSVQLDFGL